MRNNLFAFHCSHNNSNYIYCAASVCFVFYMGTWEMRFWLYDSFAQHNKYCIYFLLYIPFPFPLYPPTLSLFLHARSAYSWPTCPTMAMIDWVFTHLSTWPPSFAHGQTWNCTPSHPCSSHTSTSSFFPNKGTHSGRCVPMGICPQVWACVTCVRLCDVESVFYFLLFCTNCDDLMIVHF